MLQILRDKAQSLVIQAIVVMIALVFIFWGVGTNLMNKQEAAIVVNGEEITFEQFQRAYDQAYTRLAQQFGGTLPKGLAESFNIKQQVINQLTQEALLRQGGIEMGLMVSAPEVQKEVEDMVQFQENGAFSLERYKSILASNRMSPTKFEESLRFDLLANKTINNLTSFAVSASDFEIEDLYNLEKETVSVSYVILSPDSFLAEVEVTDEDLELWYQTAGERYQSETLIKLTYLPFSYEAIGNKVTIEEADIQAYYDQHLTEYQIPEKRHARHILLKATPEDSAEIHQKQQSEAEIIREKASNGEDFAELAKQFSEGPTAPNGGDLGFFAQGQMVKPFNDTVFAMQEGDISDVVKTDFGYHIIKLEEIQLAGIRALDEVSTEIASTLQLEQAKPLAFQVANESYEGIIGSGSLAAYLGTHPETEVVETDFFSQKNPPNGLPSDPQFLERAFALNEGELSSLVETAKGYAIISMTSIKQPEIPALSEVRETAVTDYKTEKSADMARSAAEKLIDDLNKENSSFETLAQAAGLSLQQSGSLEKNSSGEESSFPQELVPTVFRLSASNPVSKEPGVVGQDYYVYQFTSRNPPQTPLSADDRQRYRQQLLQFKQQQVMEGWLINKQAQSEIYTHPSLQNF